MRLGGFFKISYNGPDEWIRHHQRLGYSAAFWPSELNDEKDQAVIRSWMAAARSADITIAEVGAWSNTISPKDEERKKALALCQERLALADFIGASCCVNISGSRGEPFNGHHPDNFTDAVFAMVVESVRTIVDAVKPKRTFYTLEAMPWQFPESIDSYERLIKGVDRREFAVHFDPCNLVSNVQLYYSTGRMIREFVNRLGALIKSVHAKDISMWHKNTVQISEVCPGLGVLDYPVFLREVGRLGPEMTLMMEHLKTEAEYAQAAGHIRGVAKQTGVVIK